MIWKALTVGLAAGWALTAFEAAKHRNQDTHLLRLSRWTLCEAWEHTGDREDSRRLALMVARLGSALEARRAA